MAPCNKCTDRHPKCHADCERYKEWKEPMEKARKQRYKDHEIDGTILDYKEKAKKIARRKTK